MHLLKIINAFITFSTWLGGCIYALISPISRLVNSSNAWFALINNGSTSVNSSCAVVAIVWHRISSSLIRTPNACTCYLIFINRILKKKKQTNHLLVLVH